VIYKDVNIIDNLVLVCLYDLSEKNFFCSGVHSNV